MKFRVMEWEDIPSGLQLCREAGWNQLARDWELFLSVNKNGCKVCVDENDQVIGTVTTLRYQNFGWIGMLLVRSTQRGRGIGLRLLKESLQVLKESKATRLDATPAGREVYVKLDFNDEYPIVRLGVKSSLKLKSQWLAKVRTTKWDDLAPICLLDMKVVGTDRRFLFEWMFRGAPQFSLVVEVEGKIVGFCFGRPGFHATHIGPVIAEDVQTADDLLQAAIANCRDERVIIDVPRISKDWLNRLTAMGFEEQRSFMRMFRGENLIYENPERLFAIIGPEFG